MAGQHKNQLPVVFSQFGAEINKAHKCNDVLPVSLNPTHYDNIASVDINDDVTVVASNTNRPTNHQAQATPHHKDFKPHYCSIAASAQASLNAHSLKNLNSKTITTTQAIANTGAPAIFTMENMTVDNK